MPVVGSKVGKQRSKSIDELNQSNLMCTFNNCLKTFKHVKGLHLHQRIAHPTKYAAHNILYHCPIDGCKAVFLDS